MASSNIKKTEDNQDLTHRCRNLIINVGGMVYRHILYNEIKYRGKSLREFLESEWETIGATVPYKWQYDALFPGDGKAGAESAETFDITLIAYLLKTFFINKDELLLVGYNRTNFPTPTFKTINSCIWEWKLKRMFPWNTGVQADIVRIREYRNEIQHMANTKTWLSEIEFKELWNDMSAVLLNLGRAFGIPNVYFEIDKALYDPLDPKREDELMKGVSTVINKQANHDEEFKKMKENVDNTLGIITKDAEESVKHMDECKRNKKEIKKDLKGIKETVNENRTIQIEVQKDVNSLYTKIDKQTTEDNNLIECSVREMFMRQKSISDEVYVKTKAYDFASRCLSKNRIVVLRGNHGEGKTTMALKLILEHSFKRYSILKTPDDWRLVRSCSCDVIFIDDIFGVAVVSEDELKRWQNYFGEIQQAIKKGDLYVVMTVKHYILLEAKKRLMLKYRGLFDDKNIVAVMSTDMSKEENIGILSNHLKANRREIDQKTLTVCLNNFEECSTKMFPIGFPQCANLFCKIQKCYDQGDTFFQKPIHFAKECLVDIFNKKTTYDAFFLLWAEPKQSLQTKDLEEGKQDSLETLDFHKAGFIDYHEGTETYQFSHNVIADVVGLIVCERNLKDGIDFCSDDFLMMYLTTTKSADTSTTEKIFIKESRYSHLCKRLMQLSRLNKNVLLHDAFENDKILAELDKDKEQTIEIFHAACENGFSNLVKRLIQRGVDVTKHDTEGRCPIHLAAFFGHSQVVKQLLNHDRSQLELKLDAEKSIGKYKGASLMHIAVLRNYDNLLTELLNFDADLTTTDCTGKTPLLLSIETCQNIKILKILLKRKGDQIDMSDINGATPLSAAIRKGKLDFVKRLCVLVKDINCKNHEGHTLLDIALQNGYCEIVSLLQKKGAKSAADLDNICIVTQGTAEVP